MVALATRLANIEFSPSLAIADEARRLLAAGKPVIDLSVGELDFRTPENVCAAATRAIREGSTRYVNVAGLLELRQAICAKFKRENGLHYDIDQITVGCGAKQVISSALLATLNAADEVIIPVPYWTSYTDMVRVAGGNPVLVNCAPDQDFKLQPRQLRQAITDKSKWLILNSPNNPTGAVYSQSDLKGLTQVLAEFPHVGIISDDIYEHIVFPPFKFTNIAAVDPKLSGRTLVVNGVSKTYAMTGWRVGYGAGPTYLIQAINVLQSQTTTHTSSISQCATIEALNGSQETRDQYSRAMAMRAELAIRTITQIPGFTCVAPSGAFYCFVGCAKLIGKRSGSAPLSSDLDVARYLLQEALVAVVPGRAYGLSPYLRVSFATDSARLQAALGRIGQAIARLV